MGIHLFFRPAGLRLMVGVGWLGTQPPHRPGTRFPRHHRQTWPENSGWISGRRRKSLSDQKPEWQDVIDIHWPKMWRLFVETISLRRLKLIESGLLLSFLEASPCPLNFPLHPIHGQKPNLLGLPTNHWIHGTFEWFWMYNRVVDLALNQSQTLETNI